LKKELDKETEVSKADTSAKNVENTKVEASASKKKNPKKETKMTQETEMVEKAKFVEIQKQFEDQKIALEKAMEQLGKIEQEKKEAIVKSKTDAVKAVVKDEKQAAVVVKAALALEDQADFDALVEVFKSMNALLEKSGLFQEQGVSAEAAEDKPGETKLMKALKARHQAKQ
jgi:E3 ubiquitin-protein ligase DOA10